MSPKNTTLTVVFCSLLSFMACSNQHPTSQISSETATGVIDQEDRTQDRRILQVAGLDGKPLVGAKVLIGSALNQPFAANFLVTDSKGQFQAPADWKATQMVTISANGYVRTTFFNQIPNGQKFELRSSPGPANYELKGNGVGFDIVNGDNLMDFALMMPIAKKQDLFAFDMNAFISPKTDVINVMGRPMPLPSNISLPKQTEKYGIIGITLQKPIYRMYFDVLGRQAIYTVRGQFPFKQVVNEMQNGKTFTDVINLFSLKGGSLKTVDLTGASQVLDLPVNELTFNQSRTFSSPNFNNDEVLLAASLSAMNGSLMPTDLKNVPSNSTFALSSMEGETQLLMALKKKSEGQNGVGPVRFSAVIVPFQNGVRPELLSMIENPSVSNSRTVRMREPVLPSSVVPVATFSVLSKVEPYQENGKTYERLTRLWEVYSYDWISEMNLPVWPEEAEPSGQKRWEVTYVAAPTANKAVAISPRILETVTHATHSASDF